MRSPLNWASLRAAELRSDPFDHLHAPQVLVPAAAAALESEFPRLPGPGSFSLRDASPGPVLSQVVAELESDEFRALMAERFGLDLHGRATMATLRGECGPRDGFVHTDSASKVLSLLLYLNPRWTSPEGRLRLLRRREDLHRPAVEIPPTMGALLAFRRSDSSWHGHTPYVGVRRVLQFNYVRSEQTALVSEMRHRASALFKRAPAS